MYIGLVTHNIEDSFNYKKSCQDQIIYPMEDDVWMFNQDADIESFDRDTVKCTHTEMNTQGCRNLIDATFVFNYLEATVNYFT